MDKADYINGFVYSKNSLQFINMDEGRLFKKGDGSFPYDYHLKDHLGNVRCTFTDLDDSDQADIIQVGAKRRSRSRSEIGKDHFYPFGMGIDGLSYRGDLENNFLYQGKERQPEALDTDDDGTPDKRFLWYDFSARYYDPQLGRWHVSDPANQHYSGYLAMGNNPAGNVDPTGTQDVMARYFYLILAAEEAWYKNYTGTWNDHVDGIYGRGNAGLGGVPAMYGTAILWQLGSGGSGGSITTLSDGGNVISTNQSMWNQGDLSGNIHYNSSKGEYGRYVQTSGSARYYQDASGRTYAVYTSEVVCQWIGVGNVAPEWNNVNWTGITINDGNPIGHNGLTTAEAISLGLATSSIPGNISYGIIKNFASAKNADILKVGKNIGRGFGAANIVSTTAFAFSDGNFSVGDGARVLLSGATLIPVYGQVWALVDMGTLLFTGKSASDRFGDFLDEHY